MQGLVDAMADVRQAVAEGESAQDAIQAAAAEYEINPALIARKMGERYGADWVVVVQKAAIADRQSIISARVSNAADKQAAIAGQRAFELALRDWLRSPDCQEILRSMLRS